MASARLPSPRVLRVSPGLWDDPDVRVALMANNFGELFRLTLDATGGTQEALGHRIGMAQSDVSQIMRGERAVTTVKVVRSVIEGLDMPDTALELLMLGAFGRSLRSDSEEDPVERRDVLKGTITAVLASGITVQGALGEKVTAAARQPDPTTADHLAGMVQNLRELDGSGGLAGYSTALVNLCSEALAAARPAQRTEIGRVLAEAATEHWWQVWQSPGHTGADTAFQQATSLATEWDQPALVGHLLGFRSSVALREGGDPAGAMRLAQLAQEPRWHLSPGERARSVGCEIRALLALGDTEGVKGAVDTREAALGEVDADTEPAWLQWLVVEADLMRADCQLVRDGADAIPAVDAALAEFDDRLARTQCVYRARIAQARIAAGDIDGAIREIETVANLGTTGKKTVWSLGELAFASQHTAVREALADHGI
jgi:transcriptional regulator with XRE-family HTH domain